MKGLAAFIALAISGQLVAAQSIAAEYAQCGGTDWVGATSCGENWTCQAVGADYSQCQPAVAATSPEAATATVPALSVTAVDSASVENTAATDASNTVAADPPSFSVAAASAKWQAAYTKAKTALAKLSLADKVNLGTGVQWQKGHCVGNTPAISSISFPGLCLQDGPPAIRYADKVSVFPPGINAAATWNRDLIRQRGAALGAEFKGKGIHVALGPAMNMARAPAAGRNWEGFGADPYLSGEAAFETITGIQSAGVQACAKHYIDNDQEHQRDTISVTVDDRTQHEVYALPFLRSVMADVASVMCSYNKIAGTFACENDQVLNQLMKNEFGFQGYILSDWWGTHSTVASVNAGMDMSMPGDTTLGSGQTYWGQTLVTQVNGGAVSQSRIDDMATRILAGWYLLGQDSGYPSVNFDSWSNSNSFNQHVDVQGDHKTLIRKIGAASTVLLKNTNNALPLNKPASLAVIGSHAAPNPSGINSCSDRGCNKGVLAIGWGSGTGEFPYLVDPLSALTTKGQSDGTSVTSSTSDTDTNAAINAARGKAAALVFITADSGENYITVEGNAGDRNDLNAWHNGDNLVKAVASANSNTIVVVNTVGQILMEQWADNPNVTAIVWAGLPGQEAGNSLVDVLYGTVNPSGRLPYTIAKQQSDYGAQIVTSGTSINYSEGLNIDYRHFDSANITPRYEFGFGLSYTTFSYSSLSITGTVPSGNAATGAGSSTATELHNKIVTVTFTVTNTGSRAGTEIAQLYISPPASASSPPYLLKGFEAVDIAAGASSTVTIQLSRFDFSIWSTSAKAWSVPTGQHKITVGPSSRIRPLTGTITV